MRIETKNVEDFMLATDQPVRVIPTNHVPADEAKLRLNLALEELSELAEAVGLGDSFIHMLIEKAHNMSVIDKVRDFPSGDIELHKVLDALADIQYINRGTAHTYGLGNALYDGEVEAHSSNMTKVGEDGKVKRREDGKILKGEGFRQPDFQKVINKHSKQRS